jgi:hypothetical protein
MVYGPEGIGKSTLGAKSDNPIFISPEGGTDQLTDAYGKPVKSLSDVNTWDDVVNSLNLLMAEKHDFKTLVLDSADWIEKLAHQKIIGESGKDIIRANGGYGSGYRQAETMHKGLIEQLAQLREKRNMNIVIIAHTHVRPVKDPEMLEQYDSFEIKCHEFVSSLYREWVDGLFFVRFNTFVKTDDTGKSKALTDGARTLYTVKRPAFQAKNRYGMPESLPFTFDSWKEILAYAKKGIVQETPEMVYSEIQELLKTSPEDIKVKATENTEKNKNNKKQLIAIRDRLKTIQGESHAN